MSNIDLIRVLDNTTMLEGNNGIFRSKKRVLRTKVNSKHEQVKQRTDKANEFNLDTLVIKLLVGKLEFDLHLCSKALIRVTCERAMRND
jgi:hypothetical protein